MCAPTAPTLHLGPSLDAEPHLSHRLSLAFFRCRDRPRHRRTLRRIPSLPSYRGRKGVAPGPDQGARTAIQVQFGCSRFVIFSANRGEMAHLISSLFWVKISEYYEEPDAPHDFQCLPFGFGGADKRCWARVTEFINAQIESTVDSVSA